MVSRNLAHKGSLLEAGVFTKEAQWPYMVAVVSPDAGELLPSPPGPARRSSALGGSPGAGRLATHSGPVAVRSSGIVLIFCFIGFERGSERHVENGPALTQNPDR